MRSVTWIDKLSNAAGAIAAVLILPAILISTYEVIARYVFNAPTLWVFPTVTALCATSFVLAGPYVLQRNELIRVTVVYDKLGVGNKHLVDVISAIMEFAWAAILTIASGMQAIHSIYRFRGGEWRPETLSGAWQAPVPALLRGMLFVACLLFFLQAIVSLIRTINRSTPCHAKDETNVN